MASNLRGSDSRLAPVRRRLRALKVGVALAAAAAFGAALGLARDAHPGASSTTGARTLSTPARLQEEASQEFFGGSSDQGSIGAASGATQVQTHTS